MSAPAVTVFRRVVEGVPVDGFRVVAGAAPDMKGFARLEFAQFAYARRHFSGVPRILAALDLVDPPKAATDERRESPRVRRALVSAFAALALAAGAGCASVPVGVTAFADFSESLNGGYIYNIEGRGAPGPQARAGVEVDARVWRGLSVAGGIEHRSFPATMADRGEERAYVGARYRWELSK